MIRRLSVLFVVVLLALFSANAQDGPQYKQPEGGVPVLTGFVGLGTDFQPDQQRILPTIAPIVLIPVGEKWLVESELELEGTYTHPSGQPWDHEWEKGVEYAQIDYLANRYLTVVGGRFLTPFGIFNERLHSGWIRNIQTAPYITGLEMTDSTGGMLRGAIPVGGALNVNYAGFFSASVNNSWVGSTRAGGGRIGLFFNKARLEIGVSIQRQLQDEHINTYGADLTWQSNRMPFDVRCEYAKNKSLGSGYWLEGAYRMRKVPFLKAFMQKSQAEVRFEQFFAPATMPDGDMGLPESDAKRIFAGWSYWVRPDVRANFAYGREFISDGDHNVWTLGLTYRFAFPLRGGNK